METPEHLVKVLQWEAEPASCGDLSTLLPDAWCRPSACDLWEVRDVVGHLTWMAERFPGPSLVLCVEQVRPVDRRPMIVHPLVTWAFGACKRTEFWQFLLQHISRYA